MGDLLITSLRGGLNNAESPSLLRDDQCTRVENIDFGRAALGGKRAGSTAIDLTGSTLAGAVTALFRHTPSNDETAAQLWAIAMSGSTPIINYKDTAWHAVTPLTMSITGARRYAIDAQSLHGKLFLAYHPSSGNRLAVWDGTSLRYAGLAAPAAPVVADTGAAGSYDTVRYFRVRGVVLSGSTVLRRSEPSTATTFTPSGSNTGATLTKPTFSENETHWEIEASLDNSTFYRIAREAVATTTYTDTTAASTGYSSGVLSDDIGDYTVPYAPEFLAADEDRLLMAGSRTNADYASRVTWTPVYTDPAGISDTAYTGNDERLQEDTDPFLDLDNHDGGPITDMSGPVNGYIHVFKLSQIFKLIRTGQRTQSYRAIKITSSMGAIKRSVIEGRDEQGRPCLYFLDPLVGPCRMGANGIERCGRDIEGTWRGTAADPDNRVNLSASQVCHGVYYPLLNQVCWWLATDGADTPDIKIVAEVGEFRRGEDGVRRGWGIHTGPSAEALCSCLFAGNIDDGAARSLDLKPFIGRAGTDLIHMCDTGTTDNGTPFQSVIVSKPYLLGNLLRKVGVLAGAIMAGVSTAKSVVVTLIRDGGLESNPVTVPLSPTASEDRIVKELDNLKMSGIRTVQVQIGDDNAVDSSWEVDMLALKTRDEERA